MTFWQEERLARKAIVSLGLNGGEVILDIGCGTGTVAMEIAKSLLEKRSSFVIGLDAAPKMIQIAKRKSKRLNNISFGVGVAEKLPYEDESFDRVISTFFFHHINFRLKQKSLCEIWRVLKKGGTAVIVDVDTPVNLFGAFCAWCGYFIFRQEEIKENIEGKLRQAIDSHIFRSWYRVSTYLGYISIFKLEK
jgi:ubiquinone/menaquinone biosynthesis C-methylase UbiE